MQGERASLRERQGAQIVDQPREHARLVEDRLEMLRVCGVHAVKERLEIALHDRERRPELVGHVGQQPAALALAALETTRKRIEGSPRGPKPRATGWWHG